MRSFALKISLIYNDFSCQKAYVQANVQATNNQQYFAESILPNILSFDALSVV